MLVALGLAVTLARRETRWYGLLVLIPGLFFFLAAITIAAYHAQPRHLNALYPLLATLVWPGALLLVRAVRAAGGPGTLGGSAGGGPRLRSHAGRNGPRQPADHPAGQPAGRLPLDPREPAARRPDPARRLRPARSTRARLRPSGMAAALASLPAEPLHPPPGACASTCCGRYPPADGLEPRRARPPVVAAAGEVRRGAAQQRGRPRHGEPPGLPPAQAAPEVPREAGVRYVVTNSFARNQYFVGGPRAETSPRSSASTGSWSRTRRIQTFDPATGGQGAGRLDLRPYPARAQ